LPASSLAVGAVVVGVVVAAGVTVGLVVLEVVAGWSS
jgi:hypothetical protein